MCLFIFLIFIGCWIGLGLYGNIYEKLLFSPSTKCIYFKAITNGDPRIIIVPKDSQGARCGLDSHVKDKPYLFFFDLTKCFGPNVVFTGCNTPQVMSKLN